MLEKISKQEVLWLFTTLVLTFLWAGLPKKMDLLINPEYLLSVAFNFVISTCISVGTGKLISKKKPADEKKRSTFQSAIIINILLTLITVLF